MDEDTARSILGEVARLAERAGRVVRSRPTATRRSSTRRPTRAPMPESFKKSYQAYMDAECWRLGLPEELGGTGRPAAA